MCNKSKNPWAVLLVLALAFFALKPLHASAADDKSAHDSAREEEERVYELSDGVTPPKLIHHVEPDYSPGSRNVRVEGSVLLAVTVTSAGACKNPRVVKSLDKDVDQAAVDAVKQWQFEPGKKDGKPVAVNVQIEIRFHSM